MLLGRRKFYDLEMLALEVGSLQWFTLDVAIVACGKEIRVGYRWQLN